MKRYQYLNHFLKPYKPRINIYAVINGITRIWLTIEVENGKAREEGTKYAALAMTDKRVSDAWWDYAD